MNKQEAMVDVINNVLKDNTVIHRSLRIHRCYYLYSVSDTAKAYILYSDLNQIDLVSFQEIIRLVYPQLDSISKAYFITSLLQNNNE